jgi:hypothetical protein
MPSPVMLPLSPANLDAPPCPCPCLTPRLFRKVSALSRASSDGGNSRLQRQGSEVASDYDSDRGSAVSRWWNTRFNSRRGWNQRNSETGEPPLPGHTSSRMARWRRRVFKAALRLKSGSNPDVNQTSGGGGDGEGEVDYPVIEPTFLAQGTVMAPERSGPSRFMGLLGSGPSRTGGSLTAAGGSEQHDKERFAGLDLSVLRPGSVTGLTKLQLQGKQAPTIADLFSTPMSVDAPGTATATEGGRTAAPWSTTEEGEHGAPGDLTTPTAGSSGSREGSSGGNGSGSSGAPSSPEIYPNSRSEGSSSSGADAGDGHGKPGKQGSHDALAAGGLVTPSQPSDGHTSRPGSSEHDAAPPTPDLPFRSSAKGGAAFSEEALMTTVSGDPNEMMAAAQESGGSGASLDGHDLSIVVSGAAGSLSAPGSPRATASGAAGEGAGTRKPSRFAVMAGAAAGGAPESPQLATLTASGAAGATATAAASATLRRKPTKAPSGLWGGLFVRAASSHLREPTPTTSDAEEGNGGLSPLSSPRTPMTLAPGASMQRSGSGIARMLSGLRVSMGGNAGYADARPDSEKGSFRALSFGAVLRSGSQRASKPPGWHRRMGTAAAVWIM